MGTIFDCFGIRDGSFVYQYSVDNLTFLSSQWLQVFAESYAGMKFNLFKHHLSAENEVDLNGVALESRDDSALPDCREGAYLAVTAQSLNLEKIEAVLCAPELANTIQCCTLVKVGSVLVAKLALIPNAEVHPHQLQPISSRLRVEIALISEAFPTLAEPGLLLMDMDSTVIDIECIDEIAKRAGVGQQVSEVTERAMQGELDFADSLTSRVACLTGAPEQILKAVRDQLPLMPGVEELIGTLKAHGWRIAIASGGFTYFADYLKERLGLDEAVSNKLAIDNGVLTGQVEGRIVDAQVKAETLSVLAKKYGITPSQTVAMGDGANDLPMLHAANLGVAYHAKPVVNDQAQTAIQFSGLDTLLCYLR
ncbi:phosphoserine phosphatase SerB [Aestuariibacter sp. AA17]|uniref:Phosphoserine phosphatase n=1 Tax=Fluctibacter corallii TaxID=2984329 RepID=A0ABT3A3X8_9ALTE|nr:phosphoserine phosphatase SerB [Aestuariibacter sp. AA17]MCV2883239.1 phosphoserine phosphatase SerB [Aestuariibacter sp. AA17]